MRMLPRRGSRPSMSAERLAIGEWIDGTHHAAVFDRADLLALAAQLAALRLNPSTATSLNQRSVLRVEGGSAESASRIELGKVSFERFDADWAVELVDDRDAGAVAFQVDAGAQRRGPFANELLIGELRAHLADVLRAGPPISVRTGPPSVDGMTRVSVLSIGPFAKVRSPFSSDYLIPPAPAFKPGALVLFPSVQLTELRHLIDQLHLPIVVARDGGAEMIDLSGGRSDDVGFRLISTPDGSGLQVQFLEESLSTLGVHRIFRAAIATLIELARIDRPHGDVSRRATAVVDDWTKAQHADIDLESLTPIWTVRTSIETVQLPLAGDLPVAVTCTTRDVDLGQTLLAAERWLTVRQRASANDPLDAAARTAARRYFTRRPVQLSRERRPALAAIRYGYAAPNDLTVVPKVDKPDWFWGVKLRSTLLGDGRRRSTLIVDGLASSHGVLGYATELLALFEGFTELVRHRFPEAEIETSYLADDAMS